MENNHSPEECQALLIKSLPIILKLGQEFEVKKSKCKKMKLGRCYGNAASKMSKGFQYVEGVIIDKKTGLEIQHAWNVDENNNHIDFTIPDPENYTYIGIVLSKEIVYKVGWENGGTWYAVLPYITIEDAKKH